MRKDEMENIYLRKETETDYNNVELLIKKSFEDEDNSDHKEHILVKKLRNSQSFIPELSIVAEYNKQPALHHHKSLLRRHKTTSKINKQIIGHILLTEIIIGDEYKSLALAPISVLPEFQRNGIGEKLIRTAHIIAKSLGYNSIILLGHEDYYPRFGYKQLSEFNINLPFAAPKECCMAIELSPNALKGVSGMAKYPKVFFE